MRRKRKERFIEYVSGMAAAPLTAQKPAGSPAGLVHWITKVSYKSFVCRAGLVSFVYTFKISSVWLCMV